MDKKAQAIKTILVIGMVTIGVFILIGAHMIWTGIIQDYVNSHPENFWINIILQVIPFFAFALLVLMVFIPNEVMG